MRTSDEDIMPAPDGGQEPLAELFSGDFELVAEDITLTPDGREEPLADLFTGVFELVDETVAQVERHEVDQAVDRALPVSHGKGRHRPGSGSPKAQRLWRGAVGSAAAGAWLAAITAAGSVLLVRFLLLVLAALVIAGVVTMRPVNDSRPRRWPRRLADRPWRDGRDVLNLALRHMRDVFVITPGRIPLAPSAVELEMNHGDFASLTSRIEIDLVNSIAREHYQAAIVAAAARVVNDGPVKVSVTGNPAVPAGRYRLRRDQRADTRQAAGIFSHREDGFIRHDLAKALAAGTDLTAPRRRNPSANLPLRLVTNGSVTETRTSGARAGRGHEVELQLPEEPTVSRVHAEFMFTGGQWWVIGKGLNGLVLNGTPLLGEHVVRPGDLIRWGRQEDAVVSRVEIGAEPGSYAERQC
jgi:hypothetical protein